MTIAPEQETATADDSLLARPQRRQISRALGPITATRHTWVIHLVLLGVVLVGILVVLRPTQVVSADEGAVLTQAQVLSSSGRWSMPSTSKIDPTGKWFPLDLTTQLDGKAYPFTRPPIYPLVLQPLDDAGGLIAVIGLHLLALWLAAFFAGLLGERVLPGRGIQTMWLVGALSPLLFDGYWAIAHSIAAAGATAAVLGAVRVVVDGRRVWLAAWLGGIAVALSFRSESLLFAASLGVGLVLAAVVGRDLHRRLAVLLGVGSVGLAAIAYWSLSAWQQHVEGGSAGTLGGPSTTGGLIAGRLKGFQHSVLGAGSSDLAALVGIVAAGAVVIGLVATRYELLTPALRRGTALVGAVAAVVRMVMAPDLVTGLLIAAPLILGAATCVPWSRLRKPPVLIVAVTAGVTFLGVSASQHERGGTGEWGGRYFHVVLPLVCVLAVIALDWMLEHRGELGRTVVAAGLVASLAFGVLSLRESGAARHSADVLTERTWSAALTTDSADDPRGPVVVNTWLAGGRFAWSHILEGRYLTVPQSDFDDLGRRLAAADVPDFVLLAQPNDRGRIGEIGSGYSVTRSDPIGSRGWAVLVLSR